MITQYQISNIKYQIAKCKKLLSAKGGWAFGPGYWVIGLLDYSRLQAGFSLIELLIIIALMGIIGSVTAQVFFLGFKSQAKGEIVKEVKQNGDYALSVIDKMVRNAADFSSNQVCNQDATTLSIVNEDSFTTIFDCSGTSIASVSATIPDVTPTGITLTSNKVEVKNCKFRVVCPTPPLSPKYVFVNFTVSQGPISGQPTPLPENSAAQEYSGTFSLGKYK